MSDTSISPDVMVEDPMPLNPVRYVGALTLHIDPHDVGHDDFRSNPPERSSSTGAAEFRPGDLVTDPFWIQLLPELCALVSQEASL